MQSVIAEAEYAQAARERYEAAPELDVDADILKLRAIAEWIAETAEEGVRRFRDLEFADPNGTPYSLEVVADILLDAVGSYASGEAGRVVGAYLDHRFNPEQQAAA